VPANNKQDKTIDEVSKLADDVISNLGLLLVSVNIVQQGKRKVLNITIHRKNSRVSLDDCENVSRRLEAALDERANSEEGPIIPEAFVLDVESPGIDRTLKKESEYRIFQGETVELRMKEQIAKVEGLPHTIKATLVGLEGETVTVKNPSSLVEKPKSKGKGKNDKTDQTPLKEELSIPLSSLYSVKLYPDFSLAASKDEEDETVEFDEADEAIDDEDTDE
jgi:ribosome maturation factor RimP